MKGRTLTSELENKSNKHHLFIALPKYWQKEINLALKEHIKMTDEKLRFNQYLKKIFMEISTNEINPFNSNFDHAAQVKPFLQKTKRWKAVSFKKNERETIFKAIDKLEKNSKEKIQLNHYLLACIWDAMPFLEDLSEKEIINGKKNKKQCSTTKAYRRRRQKSA